jgi:ADP-heptose:LPS heptosyltransferase
MGDIVLTSPVVRVLAEQLQAEVHYLTKTTYTDLVITNPHIHQVWTFDKEPDHLFSALRRERFDRVIDLHNNLRSLRVKLSLMRPVFTFPKYRLARTLLMSARINLMPKLHVVQRYLRAVEPLGVKDDGKGLDYFIPMDTTLPQSAVFKAERYEVFAVGATHFTKRLPTERIIAICQHRTLPVVLIGGKQEEQAGAQITTACGAKVINLCGQLSLHQSALLVRDAHTVLTHDTGMMHIAAAFQKPIISFWGSTHSVLGFWPWYRDGMSGLNQSFEMVDLACRPCTPYGRAACPKGHFHCMRKLDLTKLGVEQEHV